MKKIYVGLTALIILIIGVTTYMVFCETFRVNATYLFQVLSASQVLISIYIAYLLYDRFGTSKKILEQQNEIIIDFLSELKKLRLHIYTFQGNRRTEGFGKVSKNLSFYKNESNASKIVLVKSAGYTKHTIKINELMSHPLFPIELLSSLNIFDFKSFTYEAGEEFKKEKYAFISFETEDSFTSENWSVPDNFLDLKLDDYLSKIESSVFQIENWINKETTIKIKLNFN